MTVPSYFIKVETKKITPLKMELSIEGEDVIVIPFFDDKDKIVCKLSGTTMNIFNIDNHEYMVESDLVKELKINIGGMR